MLTDLCRLPGPTVLLVLLVAGCSADDVDPGVMGVRFENDLPMTVRLAACHSDHSDRCDDPNSLDYLNPGDSIVANITADLRTEWAVEDSRGRLLRCVVLYWRRLPEKSPTIRLSHAPRWQRPCPPFAANVR